MKSPKRSVDTLSSTTRPDVRDGVLEVVLIFILFALFAAGPTPSVNEAHYLTKAKQYWNPEWCQGDLFLDSSDAHLVFYWCYGWLTIWFSLPVVAWIGRIVTWLLLAVAWQRLSWAVLPNRWISLLSAGLFALLVQYGHMAGEWVLGGVEAKGFAYFFVLVGLKSLVQRKWNWVWIWFGVASSFHVLVGGWAVVAGGLAWLASGKDRPSFRSMIPALVAGGCLSLPGLTPGIYLTAGQDPETVRIANKIYVQHRLSHHLVFSSFTPLRIASHFILVFVWIVLAIRSRRVLELKQLNLFVLAAVIIGGLGILINQLTLLMHTPEIAFAMLRYYWFRLSDVCVPIGVSLSLLWIVAQMKPRYPVACQSGLIAIAALVAVDIGSGVVARFRDPRSDAAIQATSGSSEPLGEKVKDDESWLRTCQWIREHTEPTARFLTPMRQQTFKWYAQRPELFNLKDVPQDAAALVEWWSLRREVYGSYDLRFGLLSYRDLNKVLSEFADAHDVDFLIVQKQQLDERQAAERRLTKEGKEDSFTSLDFQQVFPDAADSNERFVIFKLR